MYKITDIFDSKVKDVSGPLVYRIYCTKTGESYIGVTKQSLLKRFNFSSVFSHKSRYYEANTTKLYRAMRKYGLDCFVVYIEEVNCKDLEEREKHYIEYYDSENAGLNETSGGKSFSKAAQINGAKRLSELCRSDQKGAFFNKEVHHKVAILGGHSVAEKKARSVIEYLKEVNLEINEVNFNYYRKIVSNHNCPKYQTVLNKYKHLLFND